MTGRLYGVGVGPGDPELITLKAAKLISEADVVAYHSGTAGRSIARTIADSLIRDETIEELLIYPVTTGTTGHPLGYYGAVEDFYDESAERLEKHLDAGRTVVVLAEGDPLFYSSYMYLHDRLADRYPSELVPGVTSISAAASAIATPLARHEDILTVLPGTLPVPELARRLADTDAAAIMKLGRTFAGVREALRQAGRLDDATYVERASTGEQRTLPVAEVDPAEVPYFSMIIVPGRDRRLDSAGRATAARTEEAAAAPGPRTVRGRTRSRAGSLADTGGRRGPGRRLITSSATRPTSTGCRSARGCSGTRRATPWRSIGPGTLSISPCEGERVAVVSGGDAGVFGMASAVFEAAEAERYAEVAITVLPGVTAAQAVAAKAGAPLGGDYAVLSLSDRLKPWAVIEQRLRAVAAADLVLAIYNPASRSRRDQIHRARDVLLEVRDRQTPVVVGRHVGRPDEEVSVTTLADLDPSTIDMGCLLIIGSSQTSTRQRRGLDPAQHVPGRVDHAGGAQFPRDRLLYRWDSTKSSARNASPTMITAACRSSAAST